MNKKEENYACCNNTLTVVEFCAGYGGLGLGLKRDDSAPVQPPGDATITPKRG